VFFGFKGEDICVLLRVRVHTIIRWQVMSKTDDMKAALETRVPAGAVPVWEMEFHLWDSFSDRHVVLGREFEGLSNAEQQKALYTNAEIIVSVCRGLNFAAVTVPGGYWYEAPGRLAYYCLPEEARIKQTKILQKTAADEFMLVAAINAVLNIPFSRDYEEFCYKLFDAPGQVEQMARSLVAEGIEDMKKFRDVGVEIILNPADIADNHGVFFNPRHMERFILPYVREWTGAASQMGLYSIMHTDGNIMACIEDLADTDLNAVQSIDPIAGMDMRKARDLVGDRLCLCGNIDGGIMITEGPRKVYETTRELLLSCKQGGGFVLGTSNICQREVKPECYRSMIQAWRDHGQY